MKIPLSIEQVRTLLRASGTSIAEFCRQHDLDQKTTYGLLYKTHKGHRGKAHKAAIALGLKLPPEKSL